MVRVRISTGSAGFSVVRVRSSTRGSGGFSVVSVRISTGSGGFSVVRVRFSTRGS